MTNVRAVPSACQSRHRAALELVRQSLEGMFLERSSIIEGLLCALLAKEHVLLLGPPGTAKSALVNGLTDSIEGSRSFSWLLTKFTTPEEIFGPVSLAGLQHDKFIRITDGKLPESEIAFLDEVFKANSAILNSTLSVINERIFFNGGQPQECPLITMVGASNELPDGEELEAMFDRFALRFWVPYLTDARNVRTLLTKPLAGSAGTMTLDDLARCQADVQSVQTPDVIVDAVLTIKQRTEEQGFVSSDRRWKQAMVLLKARAYLDGDDAVSEDHLDILADVLWRKPDDRAALATIIATVGNPLNVRATEILDAAKETLGTLGAVNGRDPSEKAEWMRQASLIESKLGAMEKELADLADANPNRRLTRVKAASQTVMRMRADLSRRVAEVYGL